MTDNHLKLVPDSKEAAASPPDAIVGPRIEMTPEQLMAVLQGELDIAAISGNNSASRGVLPKPTLESLREEVAAWKKQFVIDLAYCTENRDKFRDKSGQEVTLRALHYGDLEYAREVFLHGDDPPPLTGEECLAITVGRSMKEPGFGLSLGLYIGAVLGAELTREEVITLALDSVFCLRVINGQVSRNNATWLARQYLEQLRSPERKEGPAGE